MVVKFETDLLIKKTVLSKQVANFSVLCNLIKSLVLKVTTDDTM